MRILFLTQIVPYPPDAGPRVKTWHVLKGLAAKGHEIVLATFVRADEWAHLPVLRELCSEVSPVPLERSRITDAAYLLRSLWTRRPFLVERDDRSAMRQVVAQIVENGGVDAIHADQLSMAQFAQPWMKLDHTGGNSLAGNGERWDQEQSDYGPFVVFDAHNATWQVVARAAEQASPVLKPLLRMESGRLKHFEGQVVRRSHYTLTVTEHDRRALVEASLGGQQGTTGGRSAKSLAARIHVVPIAVDTDQLSPVRLRPNSRNILTLGTLHYPPNADGIRWFMEEVFPHVREEVPEVTLTVVGKNPPPDFHQLAASCQGAIEITGYVTDLDPYFARAAVMVVPVRTGGGMRVRILEGFARGMPTVTTTVGLEGIDARPGEHVLVADAPKPFAEHVVTLIHDEGERSRLAVNGRELAEAEYDWRSVLKRLDELYPRLERQPEVASIPDPE